MPRPRAILLLTLCAMTTAGALSAQGVRSTPAPGDLVINEVHADPAFGLDGDANQDGVRHFDDDEFLEIVNVTCGDLDLTGTSIHDAIQLLHTFSSGPVLGPCEAVVVFGGGGGIAQYVASTGTLALNNDGDTVTLRDGPLTIASISYGDDGEEDQSWTRAPDLTGGLQLHLGVTGSIGRYSPGTPADGSAWCPCTATHGDNLTLSHDSVISEETYEVCDTLTLGPEYVIYGPNGHLVARYGGTLVLVDGFAVSVDGRLSAECALVY